MSKYVLTNKFFNDIYSTISICNFLFQLLICIITKYTAVLQFIWIKLVHNIIQKDEKISLISLPTPDACTGKFLAIFCTLNKAQ